VQVEILEPHVYSAWMQCLKLKYDILRLTRFAFKFNVRPYVKGDAAYKAAAKVGRCRSTPVRCSNRLVAALN